MTLFDLIAVLLLLALVIMACYVVGMLWALGGLVLRCVGHGLGWMADRAGARTRPGLG